MRHVTEQTYEFNSFKVREIPLLGCRRGLLRSEVESETI
jgi:hypothetical protein